MNGRTRRLATVCGVVFAPLLIVGYLLQVAATPSESNPPNSKIVSWLTDNQDAIQVSGLLVLLAAACLLVFVSSLRDRLDRTGGARSTLSMVSGALFAGMLVLGALFQAAVPSALTDEAFTVDADTGRLFGALGWITLVEYGSLIAAVFLASSGAVAGSAGLLPSWLVRMGYVFAVLGVPVGLAGVPADLLFVAIWVLCSTLVMRRRADASAAHRREVAMSAAGTGR